MVSRIASVHNERVRYVRSLARRRTREREGRFAVEGTRLVNEVVRAGITPALVFYTEAWAATPQAQDLLLRLAPAEQGAWLVSEEVLAACADTETPQGIIAIVPMVQVAARPGLVLILDEVRDPGNLGTLLRSAEAAGVGEALLSPGTVDPYNPKVVRAAMGTHFRLAVTALDWPAIRLQTAGRAIWLADAAGEIAYDAVDWTRPSALIVGSEACGAGQAAAELATGKIRIPMASGPESLNVAMAATVILFEAARQRRSREPRAANSMGDNL
jgi:TrmH family RNA methyltransferase